jgi:multidrug efflux system membrane fusion protein
LQDGSGRSTEGSLAVIDNTVDASTGTIHLKATFANHDSMLWPGQFVNIALTLDTLRDATVVPSEAVQMGRLGQVVFVVKPDHSVDMRPVTVGTSLGTKTVIEKGVAPGETVVIDGQMALFPGATVRAVPAPGAGSGPQ